MKDKMKNSSKASHHESAPSSSSTPSQHEQSSRPAKIPDFSFATVIEADHTSLASLALSITSVTQSAATRIGLLTTLLWRLIRHDISEELVMRPAFIQYMGDEGAQLTDDDRQDHREIKQQLLALAGMLDRGQSIDQQWLIRQLNPLINAMTEHMREESGIAIPRFTTLVGPEVGINLGKKYAATLVLTPEVVGQVSGTGQVAEKAGRNLQLDDVIKYAETDMEVFKRTLERIEQQAADGIDNGYLEDRTRAELQRIRLCVDQDPGQPHVISSHQRREKL